MASNSSASPSKVLITGSNGFVGRILCRSLADSGWRVVGVSRVAAYDPAGPAIKDVCLSLMSDTDKWQQALTSVHCVVHLAARVHQLGASAKVNDGIYAVNIEGSRFVAEQAAIAGVRRFVFLSSIKVNGEGTGTRCYSADDMPDPVDAYGRSKLGAERVLREICQKAGMELCIIRPPLVYGPGVRANFQRLLKLAALGLPLPLKSIDNRRSLVSIWNLVDFIETSMRHPDAAGATWLVSDGQDLSTPDLVRRLARLMGTRANLFAFSPALLKRIAKLVGFGAEAERLCDSLRVDITPARTKLNWHPPISVDEGLARTVDAYRALRQL